MLLQIFIPTYYGNELSVASNELSMSLFHSGWAKGSKKYKSSMRLFLENIKKPIQISAFGVFRVNLDTFNKVCNGAYSLYAVCQSMK